MKPALWPTGSTLPSTSALSAGGRPMPLPGRPQAPLTVKEIKN